MMRKFSGIAVGFTLLVGGAALAGGDGQIRKLALTPDGERDTLVIEHSGQGKFRLFKSDVQGNVIIEAENLVLPPGLTKMIDLAAKKGPVLQMTPYNSQHSGHAMAKLVLQLRGQADVTSADMPDRFVVEIMKKKAAPPIARVPGRGGDQFTGSDAIRSHLSASQKDTDVAQRLVEVLNASDEDKKYFGTKITFESKDVEVPDIFRLVGESSGLNIIWDQDVEGQKTSLSVNDLPWDQLLDIVIQQKGLKAAVTGNVVRIMTIDTFNRQAEAKKKELSLSDQLEPVIMAVIPLGYKPAADMKKLISDLLMDKTQGAGGAVPAGATTVAAAAAADTTLSQDFKRGMVDVDERTNSLVVTNTKEAIERIRRLVKELDVAVPQILIDSKIVIAQESFAKNLGVSWSTGVFSTSGVAGVNGASNGPTPPQFAAPAIPSALSNSAPPTYSPFVVSSPQGGASFGISMGSTLSANIQAALTLSEIDSLTKTVASPRVVVENNSNASVADGVSVIIAPPPSALGAAAQPTTVNATLSLTVTPQVTSAGSIELKGLTVNKSDLGSISATGTVQTTTKSLKTDVLVDSGATLVLGGVYQLANGQVNSGIPVLKDLPFIGQLFRTDSRNDTKEELMVFITPQILDPQSASQAL